MTDDLERSHPERRVSPRNLAEPLPVLFVTGMLRSGTTLLSAALASRPGVVTLGESVVLWRAVAEGRPCSCGTPLRSCEIWGPVLEAVFKEHNLDVDQMCRVDRLWRQVVRIRRIRSLAQQANMGAGALDARVLDYVRVTASLYRAFAEATGASVVVDASKTPALAAALSASDELALRCIHLVRDPRAVAYSESKEHWSTLQSNLRPPVRSASRSALTWCAYNASAEWVRHRQRGRVPWTIIRYEDFATQPESSLQELAGLIGMAQGEWPFVGPGVLRLNATHEAAGNPNRFDNRDRAIALREDWVTQMGKSARRRVTTVTAPLLRRYGYPMLADGARRSLGERHSFSYVRSSRPGQRS